MADIPDSVIGFVLGNLLELVRYYSGLIKGAEGNADDLCRDLTTLKGFVREYTKERYHENEFLKSLIKEIKGEVYKAEDLVELHIYFNLRGNSRRWWILNIPNLCSLDKKITESHGRLQKLYDEKVPAGLTAAQIDQSSRPTKKEEEDRPGVETNVVGLDDKVNDVINLLEKESEESKPPRVVSITGMFGLGKTTLANEVLKNPRIHKSFPHRAFAKVSQQYNKRKVFLTILEAFTEITEEIKGMTDDRLAKEVEKELKKRKYLIVLDDIWSKEAWDALQGALPRKKGSVILITTRDDKVAAHAHPTKPRYRLFKLTEEQSKELLMKEAGLNSNSLAEDPDLEEYVPNIAKTCQGLPLSIVVISGILKSQRGVPNWERVSENVNDYVAQHPAYKSSIRLSYDFLPFHLKQCFLYLGVFHEGSEIPIWKLLRLWIAEGFVTPNGNVSLEGIAEDYLEELVDKNLVIVSQRKSNGQIKTCLIHDMLHSFCKSEAEAENLFEEIKGDEAATVILAPRHLCIKPQLLVKIFSKLSLKHVRSFFSFAKEETPLPPSISKGFKLLRVLDVKSIIFPGFPSELHSLVFLKYIAIFSKSDILPKNISNLLHLQTLIFETSSRTLKVEADIWKMSQLKHLHTNSSLFLPSPPVGKHQSQPSSSQQPSQSQKLQTLCTISSQCCTAEFFKRTPNLKKLGIRGKLDTHFEARFRSSLFEDTSAIENLKLVNVGINSSLNFLQAKSFPAMLKRLTLKNTRLDWKQMTILGNLKSLHVLKLKDNAFQGEKLETTCGGFRRLRVLYICATNLGEWKSSEKDFPLLKFLKISDCSELKAIPSDIGKIKSLQKIELRHTNSSLDDSAKKIKDLKLQQEEGRGFELFLHPSQSKSVTVTSADDILPTQGTISKASSEEIPPCQSSKSKQAIAPNVNVHTNVPAKNKAKKGVLSKIKKWISGRAD